MNNNPLNCGKLLRAFSTKKNFGKNGKDWIIRSKVTYISKMFNDYPLEIEISQQEQGRSIAVGENPLNRNGGLLMKNKDEDIVLSLMKIKAYTKYGIRVASNVKINGISLLRMKV